MGWRAAKYIEYAHNLVLNCSEPPTACVFHTRLIEIYRTGSEANSPAGGEPRLELERAEIPRPGRGGPRSGGEGILPLGGVPRRGEGGCESRRLWNLGATLPRCCAPSAYAKATVGQAPLARGEHRLRRGRIKQRRTKR